MVEDYRRSRAKAAMTPNWSISANRAVDASSEGNATIVS